MIHLEDLGNLQAMLGSESFPDSLHREYELRRELWRRCGASGPLGPSDLVSMVRSLGLSPPTAPRGESGQIDWGRTPEGTRVEVQFFGAWQPGTFLHRIDHGVLVVKMDEEEPLKEVYPHVVRLARIAPMPEATDDEDEFPVDSPEEPPEEPPGQELPPVDWGLVEAGAEVWLCHEGTRAEEGTFVGVANDGSIAVTPEGREEPVLLPAEAAWPKTL